MYAAGLRISAPKQFTQFAAIFRPALQNPRCSLALHHHLWSQALLFLPVKDYTDRRHPLDYKSFLTVVISAAHIFVTAQGTFLFCFLFPRLPFFYSRASLCLVTKPGIWVRQSLLCEASTDLEALTFTRWCPQWSVAQWCLSLLLKIVYKHS